MSEYISIGEPSFLLGFLFLAGIINLFFFKITRENLYCFFSVFVFSYGANEFLAAMLPLTSYWYVFTYTAAFFFLQLFLLAFFDISAYYPAWNKFVIILSSCIVVVLLSHPLIARYSVLNFLFNLIPALYSVSLIITLFLFLRNGKDTFVQKLFIVLPLFIIIGMQVLNGINNDLSIYFLTLIVKWLQQVQDICICGMVLVFSWTLFERFRIVQQQLAREQLEKEVLARQREEERRQLIEKQKIDLEVQVEQRTAELKSSLNDLKATQTQLIQSEKMASLGELTAGIAHEIQNPLNFVNNFSEVSKELLGELKEELDKGDIEEAKLISDDVIQNLGKINHHGKRADAIVKGMLEHSRASTGKKEPTDINALADEYLRLSYHGLRSKDKTFNAEMLIYLDPGLPRINVIPQDIGRVLLNLFNNAFYAVNQKLKTAATGYQPEVLVTTSVENDSVVILVKDNGIGIPDAIKEKIMQPFFTTKPTGEGTGLGLSLTYDMVVKGHGGSLHVNSVEGEGSEFTIHLPLKTNSQ